MNKIIYTILILATPVVCRSQVLEARYEVTWNISLPSQNGNSKLIPISYTGTLYRKNNKYIYMERPGYLSTLSNDEMSVDEADHRITKLLLNSDTIQNIYYSDFDSLVSRYRADIKSGEGINYFQNFEVDYFPWELLPVTKEINNLHCQKAVLSMKGQEQWSVWFCADIPMQAGVCNIKSLPGLIVEADYIPLNKHYILSAYDTKRDLPDNIFWPSVFNNPFLKTMDLNKANLPAKPNRKSKQLELLKQ